MKRVIYTFCPICAGHCSAKATVKDGKIINWEQEMESGLPSEPCPPFKGKAALEVSTHPDRLKYPQRRIGARGEDKWEQISWDEALETIAKKFTEFKENYGPESVAVGLGEPKGMEFAMGQRFATAFGTPNVATPSHLCGAPQAASAFLTFGPGKPYNYPDKEDLPHLILIWGYNILQTGGPESREWLRAALLNGAKLVVIDPKRIDIAKRADLWIKPRPGSDGALAMGLVKVVIEEKLYDEDFVAKWTIGFDELREHVKTFTLDDVERVTWVPRQQVEKLARLYADLKPAAICMGGAFSQVNSFQIDRAVLILEAITSPLNIPATDIYITPADYSKLGHFFLLKEFPRKAERTLGNEFKWAMSTSYIPYQALINGILEGKRYPTKAALFILTNPLVSYPNAYKVHQALMKLDFIVVSELFMTPTAAMADIVLPAATSGEIDTVGYWGNVLRPLRAFPKLVDPPGEAWSDVKIINELAKKLGLGQYFWDNDIDVINHMLKPSGLTWEKFKEQRVLLPKIEHKGKVTFSTPSGKVEIFSKQATDLFRCSPMPLWEEVSRLAFNPSEEFPLLLTTRVEDAYKLTGDKHIEYQRNYKPQPTLELNPRTAQKLGLKEGEWVNVETKLGRIRQKLALDPDLDPRVVFASWGWWFPEAPSNLYEWDKSNANILISDEACDPATGSVQTRGIPCRVYKI